MLNSKKTKKYNKLIQNILFCIMLALCLGFIISQFFFQHTTVHGVSMQATLSDGDQLLINKIAYNSNDPVQNDIVLFKAPSGDYYIKRIIAIPGDKIEIKKNGYIYINDNRILYDYGYETIDDGGIASSPITLKEDEYFMLGDNRNFSTDSRDPSVGIISRDKIIGKAFFCIYPFDKFGKINNEANKKLSEYIDSQERY